MGRSRERENRMDILVSKVETKSAFGENSKVKVRVIDPQIGPVTHAPNDPILFKWQNWKRWMLRCYKCGISVSLDHTVTFDSNNLPTLSPSVICPECGAHYFVRNGEVVD